MTTTAEKIEVMQAFEDGQKVQSKFKRKKDGSPKTDAEYLNHFVKGRAEPQWNWERYEYRIKPEDPEPLECWVNFYGSSFYAERDEYTARRLDDGSALRSAVHMREVTPQDEQDRKDAARYRYAKEKSRTVDFLGSIITSIWDQVIDQEIETHNET